MPARPADRRTEPVLGDSIERVLAGWRATRPDLDVSPIAVLARLGRLRGIVDQRLAPAFARHGLRAGSFAILATLTRLDRPAVAQHLLARELGVTAGTLSVRLDRLVEDGLVTRAPDPADGRGTVIALTERGRAAFDACAPEHLENARALLDGLQDDEREQLAGLLGRLLATLEDPGPDEQLALALGLVVEAAPLAAERRRAVGLAKVAGLLVRHVRPDGPAGRAGLHAGDLLTHADGHALRTHADLRYALDVRPASRPIVLEIVRGARRRRHTITLS